MSDNLSDATPQILLRIREDIAAFRAEMSTTAKGLNERLDRLEEIARKQRRDSAGMIVMMRATAGDFDERVSDIEERLTALESSRS